MSAPPEIMTRCDEPPPATKRYGWGGARSGAGRKRKRARPGVSHATREPLNARFPVHVTVRVMPHVFNLRSRRSFRVLRRAFSSGGERFGLRLCEFSVQGNHLHFLVEAEGRRALSRGMQGLGIRIAKGLNRMMSKRGKVLGDRYHARILRTPLDVRRALRYVRTNHDVHRARWGDARLGVPDPLSTASRNHGAVLPWPITNLLRHARSEIDAPQR
jgi:putative transposase